MKRKQGGCPRLEVTGAFKKRIIPDVRCYPQASEISTTYQQTSRSVALRKAKNPLLTADW